MSRTGFRTPARTISPTKNVVQPHRPVRIRFAGLQTWYKMIDTRIDLIDFTPSYGPLTDLDINAFDAIVPLTIADQSDLRALPGFEKKAIVPTAEVAALCDDKLALDEALTQLGFDELRPGPPKGGAQSYPFVAKARHGDTGKTTLIIHSAEDALKHAGFLARTDVFHQRLLTDRFEYAAHFLMVRGQSHHQLTVRHEMAIPGLVKGIAANTVRSRPIGREPFFDCFADLLIALGYEGPVCIDYKIEAGRPKIMEINARVGGSLLRQINDYLDAYLLALGLIKSRPPLTQRLVDQRRLWGRRLRRARQLAFGSLAD